MKLHDLYLGLANVAHTPLGKQGASDYEKATCTGKAAFPSYKAAKAVVNRRGRGKRDLSREAYKCPFCGQWHIGTPQPKDDARVSSKRRFSKDAE